MMKDRFELFQHTADMGIRIISSSLSGLVETAPAALYSVIGEVETISSSTARRSFFFRGADRTLLFRDFLAEVLSLFASGSGLVTKVSVHEFSDMELSGEVETLPLNAENSDIEREVKAVTYHGLSLGQRRSETGETYYEATVIVDL